MRGPTPLLRLQSDERLIALVRRGNHAAFEMLVARYQSRLLAFCRHMLGSREDAEDVLQEVFAASFNAILADDRADQRAPVAVPDRAQPLAEPPAPRAADRRRLDGRPPLRGRRHDGRQGPQARGLPPARRRRAGPARDAEDGAAAARDRRALLRADRRGDGDDDPVGQVAARPRARLARRGRRGAHADLRAGPRGARRGRRGPAPLDRAGPPPRARLRALPGLQGPAAQRRTRRSPPCSPSRRCCCSRRRCSRSSA